MRMLALDMYGSISEAQRLVKTEKLAGPGRTPILGANTSIKGLSLHKEGLQETPILNARIWRTVFET